MKVLEELRAMASMPGPAAKLSGELCKITQQYKNKEFSKEEYEFLVNEIVDVRAQQETANDEIACRYIIESAKMLLSAM